MGEDGKEPLTKAPTVYIETVLITRPIKVLGVVLGAFGILLLAVSTGASAWLDNNAGREGLWTRCKYEDEEVKFNLTCGWKLIQEWGATPQALTLLSVIGSIVGVACASHALNTTEYKLKYRLYWVALIAFFLAVGVEVLALVYIPIKFIEDIYDFEEKTWNFGWAYIMGWAGAILEFCAGLFLLIDRGAEEVVYRERVEEGDGIEEA